MLHYESLALRLANFFSPSDNPTIIRDDMYQAARIGLYKAIMNFNPSKNTKFNTYVEFRIKNEIRDWSRSQDTVRAKDRRNLNKINRAVLEHEARHGFKPTADEVSRSIGQTANEIQGVVSRAKKSYVFPFTDAMAQRNLEDWDDENFNDTFVAPPPGGRAERVRQREDIEWIMKLVHPQYRPMFKMRFDLNETMLDIGYVFDLSESSISHIFAREMERIKPELEARLKPEKKVRLA